MDVLRKSINRRMLDSAGYEQEVFSLTGCIHFRDVTNKSLTVQRDTFKYAQTNRHRSQLDQIPKDKDHREASRIRPCPPWTMPVHNLNYPWSQPCVFHTWAVDSRLWGLYTTILRGRRSLLGAKSMKR